MSCRLALNFQPEDGVIRVYWADDTDGTLAFTDEGVEENQFPPRRAQSRHPTKSLIPAPPPTADRYAAGSTGLSITHKSLTLRLLVR